MYSLQQLAVVLLFVCVHDSTAGQGYIKSVMSKLTSVNLDIAAGSAGSTGSPPSSSHMTLEQDVVELVREWMVHMKSEAELLETGKPTPKFMNRICTQHQIL